MMRRQRGFTLLELLVVVAIMGMLGAVMVNSYQAIRRGMESRAVKQNVNQFIRSAYQRAQIDHQPVMVYFWNETLQEGKGDKVPVVVGKAVAVRQSGRLTYVQGNMLCDEFGDLRFNRLVRDRDEDEDGTGEISSSKSGGIKLYQLTDQGDSMKYSTVNATTEKLSKRERLLLGGDSQDQDFDCWGFVEQSGNASWKVGSAYGFEFADLQLPHGYLFGSDWKRTVSDPISQPKAIRFGVGTNKGHGTTGGEGASSTIQLYMLRQGASGGLEAHSIGSSESPSKTLSNTNS